MSRIRRVEPVDQLRIDDATLLLFETRLVQLSPLAEAVFDLTETGIELADLTTELERKFGAPADSSALQATSALVDDLVGQGILAWDREPAGEP